MNCGGQYQKYLKEALEIGLINETDIDTSLKNFKIEVFVRNV